MDRGKCKDPRATLILCASAPVSGSAPVLVSAFGASADTSRRQEMKIGDLATWYGRVVIIIKEGPAASSGTMWFILDAGNLMPVFECELETLNASR